MKATVLFLSLFAIQQSSLAGQISSIRMPSVFSDNMVLQQKTGAAFWGLASAATVANFEEIIQRIQAEQGTVNFKTMSEIINKNRENEIKMYKQNIDQADGGSSLIHGDDGSILFSVLEEADTTTATDVQRTAALEQLKKLYDARQINYQEYRHGYLHWSGKSGTADKEQTEIENFNNEVTARSMRRAANPATYPERICRTRPEG